MKVASTLATICAVIPSFSLVATIVVAIYSTLGIMYLTTARALNRSGNATSPGTPPARESELN